MNQFSPLEYDVRTSTALRRPENTGRPVRRRGTGPRHTIAEQLHRLADAIDGHRLRAPATR
ncbi:MAG TPA: hypothetical protein VK038_07080 [Ornithinicoccus sp.]|jgi:hypothetical protein|nr:hypothetical protein [Ornithinicoccus sp.]